MSSSSCFSSAFYPSHIPLVQPNVYNHLPCRRNTQTAAFLSLQCIIMQMNIFQSFQSIRLAIISTYLQTEIKKRKLKCTKNFKTNLYLIKFVSLNEPYCQVELNFVSGFHCSVAVSSIERLNCHKLNKHQNKQQTGLYFLAVLDILCLLMYFYIFYIS